MSEEAVKAETHFAPAARSTREEIEEQVRTLAESPLVETLLETYEGYLLILNEQRQVLSANTRVLNDLGVCSVEGVLGDRPGEILSCVNAETAPNGCGTARACSTCGAVISILTAQKQAGPATGECLMTVQRDGHVESLEFRVRATQLHFGDASVTLFVLNDVSGEKRREALERAFIHDLLNTIGGLAGWSRLLQMLGHVNSGEAAERILFLSQRLLREVEDHRVLLLAEKGDLHPEPSRVPVAEILGHLETVFREHGAAAEKHVEIDAVDPGLAIETDSGLLLRVLVNMVKNALEAVRPGETVNVWYRDDGESPCFRVWNPGVIPERVGLQIFRRSFTTKSEKGRGLGTYSMKLLGERYLGGRVGFESAEAEGTTFWIELPRELEKRPKAPSTAS